MTLTPERIAEITHDQGTLSRFFASVYRHGGDGCWLWTRAFRVSRCGHKRGIFNAGGKHFSASRFAYMVENGPIPSMMLVCHKCDNPLCVRPSHLFLGTHADNAIDCVTKGRHAAQTGTQNVARHERHPNAKLTMAKAEAIRSAWYPGYGKRRLAKMYGVSLGAIKTVLAGRSWKAGKPVALVVLDE